MQEKWKWIDGFEGLYKISNSGKIKSYHKSETGKILSTKNRSGYENITLIKNLKHFYEKVHRLVAKTFIPNPENKPQVNHIDCNKHNNHVNNLEWVTPKENMQHAIKNKPEMVEGMLNYNKYEKPKKVQQYSMEGKLINEYVNCKEAGKETGICSRNILQVANQKEYKPGKTRKQAGGFIWKFKEQFQGDAVGY